MTEDDLQLKLEEEIISDSSNVKEWFPYEWDKRVLISRFHTEYFKHYDVLKMADGNL